MGAKRKRRSASGCRLSVTDYPLGEVTLFPKAFSPFAVKRRSLMDQKLRLISRVVVSVNVGSAGQACFSLRGQLRTVRRLCGSRPHMQIVSCSSLAISFTRRVGTKFVLHNVHAIGSFRCRGDVTSIGHGLDKVRAFVLFARPRRARVDSDVIQRLLHCNGSVSRFIPGKAGLCWGVGAVGQVLLPLLVLDMFTTSVSTRHNGGVSTHGLRLTLCTVSGLCMSSADRAGLIRSTVINVLRGLSPRSACASPRRAGRVARPLRNGFSKVNVRFGVLASALCIVRMVPNKPSRGINLVTNSHVVVISSALVTNIGVGGASIVGHLHNPGGARIQMGILHNKIPSLVRFGVAHKGVPMCDLSTTCVTSGTAKCVGLGHFTTSSTSRFQRTLRGLGGRKVGGLVLSLRKGNKKCLGVTVSLTSRFLNGSGLVICARKGGRPHRRTGSSTHKKFRRKHLIILMSRASTSTDRVLSNTIRS